MLRRPRIKATANLTNIKRKSKQEQSNNENINKPLENVEETTPPPTTTTNNDALKNVELIEAKKLEEISKDENVNQFKLPASVERSTSLHDANYIDDVFYADIEENSKQMDLQNTPMSPMSPSKHLQQQQTRQRIKPTPLFGNRRNSLINSPANNTTIEEFTAPLTPTNTTIIETINASPLRRERYYSGSSQTSVQQNSIHKILPNVSVGRTRTESSCSNFSETPTPKIRKLDDSTHRTLARRDYEARFTNGVPDKSTFKMFDLIYYNPTTNPMTQKTLNVTSQQQLKNESDIKLDLKDIKDIKPIDIEKDIQTNGHNNNNSNESTAMPVPQLKLNSKGEVILDDTSLEIETTAEQEARKTLANSTLIYLDENTGMNGFYKRQKRTKEWPNTETIKFYRCLQTIGTDFSMMCQLFPNRTRRDLKLKFKKEERCNANLINKALLHPKIFNIDELKEQLEEEETMRVEIEQKWKDLKDKKCRTIKSVHVNTSTGARALINGDDIYNNEDVIKKKLVRTKKKDGKKSKITDENIDADTKVTKIRQQKSKKTKLNKSKEMIIKQVADIKIENADMENKNNNKKHININVDNVILEANLNDILLNDHDETTIDLINTISTIENTNTLINMDDGTIITVPIQNNEQIIIETEAIGTTTTVAATTTTPTIPQQQHELSESDIEHMLHELSDGSLVLVSTLDPNNADNVINEIFMLNKETGELYDKPLDIPEEVVQCILTVMS